MHISQYLQWSMVNKNTYSTCLFSRRFWCSIFINWRLEFPHHFQNSSVTLWYIDMQYISIFCIRHSQAKCIVVRAIYVSVYLSVPRRMPTLLKVPGCNFGKWQGVLPSCAPLGRFAISARASLLWQHTHLTRNVSKYNCTRCMADYHLLIIHQQGKVCRHLDQDV